MGEKRKIILTFPNIELLSQKEPIRLKHKACQLKFEERIVSTYLNVKQRKDFTYLFNGYK